MPARLPLLEPWPGPGPPGGNLPGVAFARLGGWILRCDAPLRQPLIDVSRVVLDGEPLLDQVGDSRGSPKLGREAERGGELLEPGEDLALLVAVQAGLRAGIRSGSQALLPPVPDRGEPTANGSLADAEDPSDVSDLVTFVDGQDGASAAPFEFL